MFAVYNELHVTVITFVQSFCFYGQMMHLWPIWWNLNLSCCCTSYQTTSFLCCCSISICPFVWVKTFWILSSASSLVNAASLPPNVWFPWSAAQYTTASSLARQIDRLLSVVFLLLCWSLGGVKGLLLFSSGTFIMERPTQPDQIRVGEEEAGMFFRVGVKLDLNFHTFRVRWCLLVIC